MDAARSSGSRALLSGLLALLVTASASSADNGTARRPPARETAARADAAFQRPLPALVDDETILRRVSIDLTGKVPSREEIHCWSAASAADKRRRLIDRLLHSEAYAINWGRYWRDVVTYHTPSSGNYLHWKLFEEWWTNQLRRNRPWNQVVTALLTASGINDE